MKLWGKNVGKEGLKCRKGRVKMDLWSRNTGARKLMFQIGAFTTMAKTPRNRINELSTDKTRMYKLLRGPIVAPFAESSHLFIGVTIGDIQNNEMHRSAAKRHNALPPSHA